MNSGKIYNTLYKYYKAVYICIG